MRQLVLSRDIFAFWTVFWERNCIPLFWMLDKFTWMFWRQLKLDYQTASQRDFHSIVDCFSSNQAIILSVNLSMKFWHQGKDEVFECLWNETSKQVEIKHLRTREDPRTVVMASPVSCCCSCCELTESCRGVWNTSASSKHL